MELLLVGLRASFLFKMRCFFYFNVIMFSEVLLDDVVGLNLYLVFRLIFYCINC